jgi:hypothetical protein
MYQWSAIVAFVPRIPQRGGKRKRDGRPVAQAWPPAELARQYGESSVKVLSSPNEFTFKGCLYDDGLAFEFKPMSLLRVLEHSPQDVTPFLKSPFLRTLPDFATALKNFAQDSLHVGNRVLVVSGEHTGIVGHIRELHDHVADVVTQIPEQHSGLIICISLRELIPYFLAGDHVKMHHLDCFGMVITADRDAQKVTFLEKKTNTEVSRPPLFHLLWSISVSIDQYVDI